MSLYGKRIDRAYRAAQTIAIDDASRIVIISDCHRGSGNWADDFARNQNAYYAALSSYYRQGFTYIELGDGDELWEYRNIADITSVHQDVFRLLAQFYKEHRLFMLYGNHDIEKEFSPGMLDNFMDSSNKSEQLMPGLQVLESLLLRYGAMGCELFLLHGHQADFMNDTLWRLARFLVRHAWRPLELIGFSDPTSAAKNNKVKEKVEKRLLAWAKENGKLVLAGHTHRPILPEPRKGRYFNDGCCIHPYGITAIEIKDGSITLVKWRQKTRDDETVYIGKDIIAGPYRLEDYCA